MNFVENNGKKVAAILCVASALPVVGTLYAMESQPGWHGDKYVKEDHKVAKGWTKVGSKSYYFDENGNVDKTVSRNASATVVSTSIADATKDVVKESATAAVDSEAVRLSGEEETKTVTLSNVETEVVSTDVKAVVDETNTDSQAQVISLNTETTETTESVNTLPSQDVVTPSQSESAPVQDSQTTVDQNTNTVDQNQYNVDQNTSTQDQTTVDQNTNTADQTVAPSTDTSYQQRIADAALAQVGQHKWCTDVATDAVNAAGGQQIGTYWPSGYMNIGTVFTDRSQLIAGDLVYYQNDGNAGSAGVVVPDHVAVYVGDNTVVNGGWNYGPNVATSDIDTPSGTQYYIRVNG